MRNNTVSATAAIAAPITTSDTRIYLGSAMVAIYGLVTRVRGRAG